MNLEAMETHHFDKFDLLPLSFSHINEFAFYRSRWALRRIFGYEFPTSAAAERGSAVESGLNMLFNGKDMKFASEKMHYQFDENVKNIFDDKVESEKNSLDTLLEHSWDYFTKQNWNLIDYQKKVYTTINDIPVIGYTDFHFEDKETKEDFYVDLKTTKRLPNKISLSHAMQQSIYAKATNARQNLVYSVYRKTKPVEVLPFALEDTQQPLKIATHIVRVMENYLATVESTDDVKLSIIPNPDDWLWNSVDYVSARKEVWGY